MHPKTHETVSIFVTALAVDKLGELRAQIADLQDKAKAIEAELKAAGDGTYEGELFRATVSTAERTLVDWKAVAGKLDPSRQLVTAHTTHRETCTLRVNARKRAA